MDKIKEKIQSLCPDVMGLRYGSEIPVTDPRARELVQERPITLSTVLRAIGNMSTGMEYTTVDDNGKFWTVQKGKIVATTVSWNLEQDNYDAQSEECKQFIGSLLGV